MNLAGLVGNDANEPRQLIAVQVRLEGCRDFGAGRRFAASGQRGGGQYSQQQTKGVACQGGFYGKFQGASEKNQSRAGRDSLRKAARRVAPAGASNGHGGGLNNREGPSRTGIKRRKNPPL